MILVALQTCGVFALLLNKFGCGWLVFETLGIVDELELKRGENRLTTRKNQAIRQAQQENMKKRDALKLKHEGGGAGSSISSLLFSSSSRGVSLVNQGDDIHRAFLNQETNDEDEEGGGGGGSLVGRSGDQGIGRELSDEWGSGFNQKSNHNFNQFENRFNKQQDSVNNEISTNQAQSSKKTTTTTSPVVSNDHSYLPPSILPASSSKVEEVEEVPQVVKKVITCKKCGEIIARDMDAIEAHEETCVGYNDENNLNTMSGGLEDNDGKVSSESQMISNAFVCPQCFKEFPSQRHVLDHFPNCQGQNDNNDIQQSNNTPTSSIDCQTKSKATKRSSITSRMFKSSKGELDISKPKLSLDGSINSEDHYDSGAVAALNDMLTGGSGGGNKGCGPGMALSGWIEKHNKIKVYM